MSAKAKQYRLLFVAMSGVRVKNQELLSLGMTLPGFVERSEVIASLPSLSLLTLAAFTPGNWDVEYLDIDVLNESAVETMANGGFDLVAISSLSARIFEAYRLADRLRGSGMKVVLGGLHVSALPEEARPHADAVVQGEGERIWPALLADFEQGGLKPIYSSFTPDFTFDLKSSRVPRYDLLDITRYNRIPLQTARGCPHHCNFCAASRTISGYKLKPIEQVRRELEAILAVWDKPFIELADDNTFVNKTWARQLAKLFAEYPVKWFTETDISLADDDELLELLANSRCAQVLIGFESPRPKSLRGVDTKDWKYRQFETYRRKIEKIQSYGISVNGCFILGFDTDDSGIFDETYQFVTESGLSEVQITLLTPFPGTALYKQLAAEKRLLKDKFWDECTLFDVTFTPQRMTVEELRHGFNQLMSKIYAPAEVSLRKRKWTECVRTAKRTREKCYDF